MMHTIDCSDSHGTDDDESTIRVGTETEGDSIIRLHVTDSATGNSVTVYLPWGPAVNLMVHLGQSIANI